MTSHRPRFNRVRVIASVKAEQFNELVEMYNDLADEYEDLFIKDFMRTEVMQMLDGKMLAVISSVAEVHDCAVREEGYAVYKKAVLGGDKRINSNSVWRNVFA